MMRPRLSPAASALIHSLLERAGIARDRIILTQFEATDWHSLTFSGERHEICLRINGPDSAAVAQRLLDGLGEQEWRIPGSIVADVALDSRAEGVDGSVALRIEALTILDE